MSDDELAEDADQGLRGQGAVVESNRRLAKGANRLSWAVAILTLFIAALTVVLVYQGWNAV